MRNKRLINFRGSMERTTKIKRITSSAVAERTRDAEKVGGMFSCFAIQYRCVTDAQITCCHSVFRAIHSAGARLLEHGGAWAVFGGHMASAWSASL